MSTSACELTTKRSSQPSSRSPASRARRPSSPSCPWTSRTGTHPGGSRARPAAATFTNDVPPSVPVGAAAGGVAATKPPSERTIAIAPVLQRELDGSPEALRILTAHECRPLAVGRCDERSLQVGDDRRRSLVGAATEGHHHSLDVVLRHRRLRRRRPNLRPERREPRTARGGSCKLLVLAPKRLRLRLEVCEEVTGDRLRRRLVDRCDVVPFRDDDLGQSHSGSGRRDVSAASGRAGIPAAKTSAPNASAPARVAPAATGRGHRLGNAAASRPRRAAIRTGPTSSTSPLVAQTSASEPRMATFVANSVVCGAISSVARSPTATA